MSAEVESSPAICRRSSCFTSSSYRAALCRSVRSPMNSRLAFTRAPLKIHARSSRGWLEFLLCSPLLFLAGFLIPWAGGISQALRRSGQIFDANSFKKLFP